MGIRHLEDNGKKSRQDPWSAGAYILLGGGRAKEVNTYTNRMISDDDECSEGNATGRCYWGQIMTLATLDQCSEERIMKL